MSVLILSESNGKVLDRGTLSAVTAAKKLSDEVDLLLLDDSNDVLEFSKKIVGINKIICAYGSLEGALAENLAPVLANLSENYSHIISSAGTFGKNILPRVAALCDSQQISDVSKIIDNETFVRPIYAGNALATVKSLDDKKFITIRATAFQVADTEGGSAQVVKGPNIIDTNKVQFCGRELSKSDRPELTAAKIVVSGGRGLGSGENFSILDSLADKLGAAVGASRAAVDTWEEIPHSMQVGQTGKTVNPSLYIAVGISGAIQHLAGMRTSKYIVAINKDGTAPIFRHADYGIIATWEEALPLLEQELGSLLG